MSNVVSKSQFKPKALEYFREVQETGSDLVITEHGRPVLKISRYAGSAEDALAALRDSVLRYENPTEPVAAGGWESVR